MSDDETVKLSEATLRGALSKLLVRRGAYGMLVLHPDTYAQATRQGLIEDGMVRWDRIADVLHCTHKDCREEENDGRTYVVCDGCGAQRETTNEREEP